jgi:CBS domain-containing protein
MRTRDILSSPVATILAGATASEARSAMRAGHIRHLVVTAGRTIVGVISHHDLRDSDGAAPIDDLMSTDVVTASPLTTIREAANLLRGHNVGCLPVVERGRPVGIVTVSDLLELIGRGAAKPVVRGERTTLAARGPRKLRPPPTRSGARAPVGS